MLVDDRGQHLNHDGVFQREDFDLFAKIFQRLGLPDVDIAVRAEALSDPVGQFRSSPFH